MRVVKHYCLGFVCTALAIYCGGAGASYPRSGILSTVRDGNVTQARIRAAKGRANPASIPPRLHFIQN